MDLSITLISAPIWLPLMLITAGALTLELRAAADLRRLELADGETGDVAGILRSTVARFTEGHDSPDLRDAIELLS